MSIDIKPEWPTGRLTAAAVLPAHSFADDAQAQSSAIPPNLNDHVGTVTPAQPHARIGHVVGSYPVHFQDHVTDLQTASLRLAAVGHLHHHDLGVAGSTLTQGNGCAKS